MKRTVAILCIAIAFVVGIGGGYILANIPNNDIVGVYYSEQWNGKSATLILDEDGTCKYPTGEMGSWKKDGETITIRLVSEGESTSSLGTSISSSQLSYDHTYTVYIVEDGILLHDCLFYKK